MNKQVDKDRQMSGNEFIRLFCISHGIPMGRVAKITITASYDDVVVVKVDHLGTYRLLEMTTDGRIGNVELIDDESKS